MAELFIEGPSRLGGEMLVHGAKNSALPILAASILCTSECVLHNCPALTDVGTSVEILETLGCRINRTGTDLWVDPTGVSNGDVPDGLMRKMRSSIVLLGAIVSKLGQARLTFPGGCELGPRPIDLHLEALRKMGLHIEEDGGSLVCAVRGRLHGEVLRLKFPSVGATENLMIAASCAQGTTVICNAAREPEICDLADFLNRCGAKVAGAGGRTVTVEGVERLHGCEHRIIPDRIVAATYLAAAAATGSALEVRGVEPEHLSAVLSTLEETGCTVRTEPGRVALAAPSRLRPVRLLSTRPYPGFPTDAQAPLMAAAATAEGESVFVENIFESRYKHAPELCRMGAEICIRGRVASVRGVPALHGAQVAAPDLRGGAALVIAGLAADGETRVSGLEHIDRGYERLEQALAAAGANIRRMEREGKHG